MRRKRPESIYFARGGPEKSSDLPGLCEAPPKHSGGGEDLAGLIIPDASKLWQISANERLGLPSGDRLRKSSGVALPAELRLETSEVFTSVLGSARGTAWCDRAAGRRRFDGVCPARRSRRRRRRPCDGPRSGRNPSRGS